MYNIGLNITYNTFEDLSGDTIYRQELLKAFNLEDYWITDPQVSSNLVIAATITLIVSGTIAGYIPAKRAAGVKPIIALRDE